MKNIAVLNLGLSFLLAPLLPGVINRVKAVFAGRRGRPILQLYYDILKLLQKNVVYSRTVTPLFYIFPIVAVSAIACAGCLVPWAAISVFSFEGDMILFLYLLGAARFFMVVAALDTGSSFEGMGASREVQFAVLAEPAFFIALAALARGLNGLSLKNIYAAIVPQIWAGNGLLLCLSAGAIFLVLLAEACRVPIDDPDTHLELTMIHEVMVLDHSGPDLACILYGAALKMWFLGMLLIGMIFSVHNKSFWYCEAVLSGGMLGLGVAVGLVESMMARLRLLKVPLVLLGAAALAVLAIMVTVR